MAKRAPLMCRNQCGTAIWFDWEHKYDDLGWTPGSEKPNIPLEVGENGQHLPKKHQCPNSEYAKKQQQPTSTTTSVGGDIEAIKGMTLDIVSRVDKLDKKFDELIPRFDQLVQMYQAKFELQNMISPDDDRDNNRESPEDEP